MRNASKHVQRSFSGVETSSRRSLEPCGGARKAGPQAVGQPSVRLIDHPTSRAQQSGAVGLVIIAEEDTRTLLIHRISFEDIYQRQGGAQALRNAGASPRNSRLLTCSCCPWSIVFVLCPCSLALQWQMNHLSARHSLTAI